jgi:NDP-sugar pyrophosphorylase family protein
LKERIDILFLCGGKGIRLRPYTNNTPKPLLLVNNKPFLFHLINKVKNLITVQNIIIAGGYKVKKIVSFVKKDFKYNNKIIIIDSGEVDIIQRIKDATKYISNDFMVCYGDTYAAIDLKKYINKFKNNKKNICSMVGSMYQIKYGTVRYNKKNNMVSQFREKPIIKDPINLGYFLFKKELISKFFKYNSWEEFLKNLAKSKKIKLFITNQKYFSFDNPSEYNKIKNVF